MWSTNSSQVVLTGVNYNTSDAESVNGVQYSPKVTHDGRKSSEKDSGADDVSSRSADSVEHEDLETHDVIVHRDVAKWVEPVGGGRHFDAEKSSVKSICIIGTGDFGRALASKLVQAGYSVKIGSRNPDRNRDFVERSGAYLTTIPDAIYDSDVVIVAVAKDFYKDLPFGLLAGKIVVDVSNRTTVHRKMEISQAEYLQGLIPRAAVVKAFNVLSAYVLENGGLQGSKEVYYAGDVHSAKQTIESIIRGLGFIPIDRGSLRSAREIEDIPVQRFPKWKIPLIISVLIYLLFFFVAWGKFQICWTLTWDGYWHWDRWNYIPMTTVNSALACHALSMLTLCYFPGVIAAYIQLFRGTKFSRFPNWLDQWLKMRKQLGLLMLFSAALHAFLMMAVFSPKTHNIAFDEPQVIKADVLVNGNWSTGQNVSIFSNTVMKWRGECFITTGVVAFVFAILLGITSLPSVSASLSWKEFAFIQSNLGWLCLVLTCAHDLFYGWPYINGPSCTIPSTFQYVMYFPGLTILLKIPLLLPCVSSYLNKIRGGYESKRARRKVSSAPVHVKAAGEKDSSSFTIQLPATNGKPLYSNGRMINIRST